MDDLLLRDKVFVARMFITRNILSQCESTSYIIIVLLSLNHVLVFYSWLFFLPDFFDSPIVFCSRQFDVQRGVQYYVRGLQTLQSVLRVCLDTTPKDPPRLASWANFRLEQIHESRFRWPHIALQVCWRCPIGSWLVRFAFQKQDLNSPSIRGSSHHFLQAFHQAAVNERHCHFCLRTGAFCFFIFFTKGNPFKFFIDLRKKGWKRSKRSPALARQSRPLFGFLGWFRREYFALWSPITFFEP